MHDCNANCRREHPPAGLKNKYVMVRISEEGQRRAQAAARINGESTAAMLRRLALAECQRLGV